eukprot:CAMPEP_0179883596 /NCGR_PEP_ID=MMETSP0982-20121206/28811_1 /TAXON_ID=483367 /ORGANISM="non described non described, Strain CCMP 2436" /LENGTH=218 /DNA_ID=CAMNT_0021778079 /DNA_START=74 /DNA_END=731 /DNA_ORIENTATION=-
MRDSVHRRLPEARARAEAWPPDLQLPYGNRSALRAQGKRSEGRGPGVEGDAARAVEVVLDEGRARERGLGERHVLRSLPVHLVEGAVRAQALGLVRAHGEQRLPALGVPRVVRVIDRVGRLATKRRLANVEEEVGAVDHGLSVGWKPLSIASSVAFSASLISAAFFSSVARVRFTCCISLWMRSRHCCVGKCIVNSSLLYASDEPKPALRVSRGCDLE